MPSGVGLLALGCSMLSLGSCIVLAAISVFFAPSAGVVVVGLPLLGLAGIVLGALSLVRKRAPNGREYERGPAVGAIIVGLATAVLQGAFGVGILRVYLAMPEQVVPVVGSMMEEIGEGNLSGARRALADPVQPNVPEARLGAFAGEVRAVCGPEIEASFSVGTIGRARAALTRALSNTQGLAAPPDLFPKPVELVGSEGRLVVWLLLDDASLERDRVRIVDMMAMLPDGRCLVLLPAGRFAQFARQAGLGIVDLPTAAPAPAPGGASGAQP